MNNQMRGYLLVEHSESDAATLRRLTGVPCLPPSGCLQRAAITGTRGPRAGLTGPPSLPGLQGARVGPAPQLPAPGPQSGGGQGQRSRLTIPFCTLKPSWYLRSGRLMRTVVTGGQLTMLSFTCVWFFRPCRARRRVTGSTASLAPRTRPLARGQSLGGGPLPASVSRCEGEGITLPDLCVLWCAL